LIGNKIPKTSPDSTIYTRAKWKFGRIKAGLFSHAKAKFFGIASATAINFNEGMGEKTK